MTRVLIYTQNFGRRDKPQPMQEQTTVPTDFLYITDDPDTPVPRPWRVLLTEPTHEVPNLAAKWWRTHPPFDGISDELTPGAPYDYCIHLDANMELRVPTFARTAIDSVHDGVAVWRHPRRDCIVDEAEASLGAEAQGGRYDHLPLREQVQSYLDEGYPRHHGLYATGTTVWTRDTAKEIGDEWYEECVRWSYQDQLSFPVVCWRHGIEPGVLPLPQTPSRYNARSGWWANAWMRLHNHREGTG